MGMLGVSSHKTTRRLIVTGVPLAVLAIVAATPGLLGHQLTQAAGTLRTASPGWLWLAVAAFLVALVCTVFAWRSAICATGAEIGRVDASARYGVGCLVNSFAPASLGDAVRVTLLAQRVERGNGLWTVSGAAVAVAVVRGVTLCSLVLVVALATHALPLWPVFAICGGAALASIVAYALWRRHPHGRLGDFVGAFTALARSPRAAASVAGWSVASQAARLVAGAAVAAALSVPHPLLAALVIMPTLQLATMFPITPGNVGVATGAVALALQTRGVELSQAIATGLAYHAAETLVGVSFGLAGTLAVVELPPLVRRVAAAGGLATVAAFLGATVVSLV